MRQHAGRKALRLIPLTSSVGHSTRELHVLLGVCDASYARVTCRLLHCIIAAFVEGELISGSSFSGFDFDSGYASLAGGNR